MRLENLCSYLRTTSGVCKSKRVDSKIFHFRIYVLSTRNSTDVMLFKLKLLFGKLNKLKK